MAPRIVEIVAGPSDGNRRLRGNDYLLDSGLRMDYVKGYPVRIGEVTLPTPSLDEVKEVDGRLQHKRWGATDVRVRRPSKWKDEPVTQIIGSKVLVIDGDKSEFYLCNERDKGWDFPGGKLEFGETPVQAAVRELFEETGTHYFEDQLVSLGHSDHVGPGEFFRSYLFVTFGRAWKTVVPCRAFPLAELFQEVKDSVVWYTRLVGYLNKTFTAPMLVDMALVQHRRSDGLALEILSVVKRDGCIPASRVDALLKMYRPNITGSGQDILMTAMGLRLNHLGNAQVYDLGKVFDVTLLLVGL